MKVNEIELQPLIDTTPGERLADAADRMRFYEIGSLAVMERGRLVGILTERDLVRALADRADPDETPVSDYMTREPATVAKDSSIREARRLMVDMGVRHLPVVDGFTPLGMISARDLLEAEAARR